MKNIKSKNYKLKLFFITFFILIILILVSIYTSNNKIQTTYLNLKNKNVANPIKIVHISDLHLHYFGKNNETLINKIKRENPDLIFITGDVCSFSDENLKIVEESGMQRYNQNIEYTISTLNQIHNIAPTFFSLGNHEHVFEKFDQGLNKFKQIAKNIGVSLLINEIYSTNINGTNVNILGTDNTYYQDININKLVLKLEKLDGLKIILDHYPFDFALNGKFSYINFDVDYVFSGHEHGGQIRIPFIGAIISHAEGFFPTYAEGVHTQNNSTLIISRGLGNSSFPTRIFNRPELIVVNIMND